MPYVLSMPEARFRAWAAYYAVEPWGMVDRLLSAESSEEPEPEQRPFPVMAAELGAALGVTRNGAAEGS